MREDRAEIVVIGSGPGGATAARALARAGRDVLLLERGRDWRGHALYGTYPGALLYADRRALLFTDEGLNIIRPLMLGGATSMYCGCASPPASWWREDYGIELDAHARAAAVELGVAPLPAELRGTASTRVAEAGSALGMNWLPQDKFMQPARALTFDCSARCMLGCRCGAKWNAAEFVDDGVRAGLRLRTGVRVQRVLRDGAVVRGVEAMAGRQRMRVEAATVIVAAGGIGSARLLRASGVSGAGRGMAMDTTVMVYGAARGKGQGGEPPMTWSAADDELGVLYSTLVDPWLMYPIIMVTKGPMYALSWHRWSRTLGVMIKLRDEVSGEIRDDGGISKGLTTADRARLERAEHVAHAILAAAGCSGASIFTTPLRGTHPCATARIDDVVDRDLQTEVRGLYVCDASVFPRALARPTVLTIIALAERLATHLLANALPAAEV